MKEKIILRLRALYPGVNISKARMDAIADKLKVTEETEIDEKLEDLNSVLPFADIAKHEDWLRAKEALDKKKAKEAKEKEDKELEDKSKQDQKTPKDLEDVPEWAKGLIESQKAQAEANKTLSDKLAAIESGKTSESRKQALKTSIKDAPEVFQNLVFEDFDRITFSNDEEFDAYKSLKEARAKEFNQHLSDAGLKGTQKPFSSQGADGKKIQASKEELDAVMANL